MQQRTHIFYLECIYVSADGWGIVSRGYNAQVEVICMQLKGRTFSAVKQGIVVVESLKA